jgi:hypothetical protein
MEKYIHRVNVALFKKRLAESHSDAEREVLFKLLVDEEAKEPSPKNGNKAALICIREAPLRMEDKTRMVSLGTGFRPNEIKLMRTALDEASTTLPEAERTSAMKTKLASRILAAAAKGERDPNKLRIAALLEEMDV